jgi:hypothetical protein
LAAFYGRSKIDVKLYKIFNPTTKLYAGAGERWNRVGKTWHSIGHVKSHLRNNLTSVLKPHDNYRQTLAEVIQKNKIAGCIYKNCELHTFSAAGMISSPLSILLEEMKCLGYAQNKEQSVAAKLRELYGDDYV